MNGLSNNIYPYSLNNLQTITTSDGGSLPVSCNAPLIENTTSTNQNIYLYESATDLIDFSTYSKSLKVKDFIGATGTFNAIYSTGARFFSLNATGATVNTITATSGFTGGYITASSGTFNFVNTNTLTANTINIGSLNIPNITFTIATGGYLTATGTITSRQSLRTTNGNINTFDFTDISSDGDTSIYNAGGALQTSFRFDGNERMKLSTAGKLDVSFLQSSGAFTGASVATTGIIRSGGILSTTSGRIANGNSAWTTNLNDVFINANNDTIYFRPKGETATPADAQVYLLTNGSLVCTTGTLTAENIYSYRGANFPNAYVSVYGIDASYQINSPYFTGTSCSIRDIKGATGNFSNTVIAPYIKPTTELQIRNGGGYLSFYNGNGDKILEAQPAFGANKIISFYDYQPAIPKLQFQIESTSSGAYVSYIDRVELLNYLYSPTIQADNYQPTTSNGIQSNTLTFRNNTSVNSRPFIFCNTGQSAYIQALGVNSRNNGFAIRDTAERWFMYNKANTSTLAFNNNSSDLMTLDSLSLTVVPETKIQNTLNVGAPNFGSNALINLGYTGVLGTSLNSRMGYLYHDASNLVLNNQQYNNANLQNSTIGSVYISPANGVYPTIYRPSGQFINANKVESDAGAVFNCFGTGSYGLYVNKPNTSNPGNNYYALVVQGTNYGSAFAFHPNVNGVSSNLTIGSLNYPNGSEAITIRPTTTSNQPVYTRLCNSYLDNVANGVAHYGLWGTGSNGIEADFFINNYSDNSGSKKSGIRFNTDTNTYGTTCTAQYISYDGQTFFNPYTLRGAPNSNSQTGSAFSVIYGFKYLPQVGTVYTSSRGGGAYIPWVKALCNNANYTVAGGTQKIALADDGTVNASPWQTPAGARQYSFRCDFRGVYDVRWNINIFALATTQYFLYVYKNGAVVSTTIGDISRAGTFTFCNGATLVQCNAGDDIDMRVLPDTQTITVGNNSTIQAMYQG